MYKNDSNILLFITLFIMHRLFDDRPIGKWLLLKLIILYLF